MDSHKHGKRWKLDYFSSGAQARKFFISDSKKRKFKEHHIVQVRIKIKSQSFCNSLPQVQIFLCNKQCHENFSFLKLKVFLIRSAAISIKLLFVKNKRLPHHF